MLITITGTPTVGKSTLAVKLTKTLAKTNDTFHFDLHNNYRPFSTNYNRSKRCYDIDLKALAIHLKQLKKQHQIIIFDSHISHLLPSSLIDLCVVLTHSNLKNLRERLEKRKYHKAKIQENLECEIMQICQSEAQHHHKDILSFDTAKLSTTKIIKEILKQLHS